MNYLRAKLEGEAADVILGLTLTNANYEESIRLLQERCGQNEIVINAYYTSLMDLPASSSHRATLRKNCDIIEKHLRSLTALGEDINTKVLVSLIMSKLPKDVLSHLTDQKEDGEEWTVQLLRNKLHKYIASRENADRQWSSKDNGIHPVEDVWSTSQISETKTTTEASFSNSKPPQDLNGRKEIVCIYCRGQHWSDECSKFATVKARKEKIKGHCFICLKRGHHQKDCTIKKACAYYKQKNRHHRSLCIDKFPVEKPFEMANPVTEPLSGTVTPENTLLASDEQVLIQTATVELENLQKSRKVTTRLLLDTGSQRTYITKELAERLQLLTKGSETLTVYTFSTAKPRELHTPFTELRLLTKDGSALHLRVNVVPKITGTLQRARFDTKKISHVLKGFPLADSIPSTRETASIELLLGNDYYCDKFAGDISLKEVALGLNLMQSKLGWILTGRVNSEHGQTATSVSMLTYTSSPISVHLGTQLNDQEQATEQKPELGDFWNLEDTWNQRACECE